MAPNPTLKFQPVRSRQTVQDAIFGALRGALMAGQFDPGQVLTIGALADSFGTSHMPVREALRRLAAEGAVELAVNGSSRVPLLSRERLDDLFQTRMALEALAIERAAARVTPALLREARIAADEHEAVTHEDGVGQLLRKNQSFHFLLYRASGSEVLPQLIEVLWLRFGPYLRMLSRAIAPSIGTTAFANGSVHHRALLRALEAGDVAAARKAVQADIKTTYDLLAPMIGTSPPDSV